MSTSKLALESHESALDPSTPTAGRCDFFELPRELRDMVYKFALHHENGLVTSPHQASAPVFRIKTEGAQENYKDPNNLRHVCRQLHEETKGVLFKMNTVTFRGEHDTGSKPKTHTVSALDHFVNTVITAPKLPQSLKRIAIEHPIHSWFEPALFNIVADDSLVSEFCCQRPSITVVLRLRTRDAFDTLKDCILIMSYQHYIFRGLNLSIPFDMVTGPQCKSIEFASSDLVGLIHPPQDPRFSIMGDRVSTSAELQAVLQDKLGFDHLQLKESEELIAWAMEIFEDGV